MTSTDERDYAEESCQREFCPACGTSPCEFSDDYAAEEALDAAMIAAGLWEV
jgi:hypothetical protein